MCPVVCKFTLTIPAKMNDSGTESQKPKHPGRETSKCTLPTNQGVYQFRLMNFKSYHYFPQNLPVFYFETLNYRRI